jgi:hypothetical protein
MTPEERDTMIGAEMEAQLPPEFRLDYKEPPPKPPVSIFPNSRRCDFAPLTFSA